MLRLPAKNLFFLSAISYGRVFKELSIIAPYTPYRNFNDIKSTKLKNFMHFLKKITPAMVALARHIPTKKSANYLYLIILPIFTFWAFAALSYLDASLAITCCAAWCLFLTALNKEAIFALSLSLLPFSQVFAFAPSDMQLLNAFALACSGFRYTLLIYENWKRFPLKHSYAALIMAGYTVILMAHFERFSLKELLGTGLLFSILSLILAARYAIFLYPRLISLTLKTMVFTVLAAAVVSVFYQYIPLPWLIATAETPDTLRLLGVFDGTNAGAHLLLVPFYFSLVHALHAPSLRSKWSALLILTTFFIASTGTKSAIGSILGIFLLAFFLVPADLRKRLAFFMMVFIAFSGFWIVKIAPMVEYNAAINWNKLAPNKLNSYLASPPKEMTISQALSNNLRFGESSEMKMDKTGHVNYTKRPYNIWGTGQRDRTWRAGIDTIKEHPWWGIGYKKWQDEMMKRLSYPFRSPHNGFMEVTGAIGILGATLYTLLTLMIGNNLLKVWKFSRNAPLEIPLLWVTLTSISLFSLEIADVSSSLAVTLSASWFWLLISIQESLLLQKTIPHSSIEGDG